MRVFTLALPALFCYNCYIKSEKHMQIKPEDIKIDGYTIQGNWGMSGGVRVTVTHVPTGIESVATGKLSMHKAKQLAYESLLKRLEQGTDYYKQLELF